MITRLSRRFGLLTIIECADPKTRKYRCKCDCGGEKIVDWAHLKRGSTKSCGCLRPQARPDAVRSHSKSGVTSHPLYSTWRGMLNRCENPNSDSWMRYGGRGVKLHPEWNRDFFAFVAYVGEKPTPEHSIDRWPDRNGNYEPGNVRWATQKQQQANTDQGLPVLLRGVQVTSARAARELDVSVDAVKRARGRGLLPHEALAAAHIQKEAWKNGVTLTAELVRLRVAQRAKKLGLEYCP